MDCDCGRQALDTGRNCAEFLCMIEQHSTLNGQLLIAMPGMGDPRFEKSVIFMCAHSADGALGLIVNKPSPELAFSTLLQQLDIDVGPPQRDIRVHFGGPVEKGRRDCVELVCCADKQDLG